MVALSESYAKTSGLLDAGKTDEAATEFRKGFVQTIKKLYSEASQTYPLRFSKIGEWCGWINGVYILTGKADKALEAKNVDDARKLLADLRKYFYDLHAKTETLKSNDFIYAYLMEATGQAPDAAKLKSTAEALEKAEPSAKAKAAAEAYQKARTEWSQAAGISGDGKVDAKTIEPLRKATESFYRAFGIQFE